MCIADQSAPVIQCYHQLFQVFNRAQCLGTTKIKFVKKLK